MKRFILAILLQLGIGASACAQGLTVGTMPACAGYDENLVGCPVYHKGTCKVLTVDGVIASSAGVLQSIYIAAVEAGDDFIIYDNASAAGGTKIFEQTNLAAGDKPFPLVPATFGNGAYLDVTAADGSAGFTVTVCYSD